MYTYTNVISFALSSLVLKYPLYFRSNNNKPDAFNIVISPFNIEVKYNTVHIQSFDYNIVHIIVIKGYPEIVCLKTKRELYIY